MVAAVISGIWYTPRNSSCTSMSKSTERKQIAGCSWLDISTHSSAMIENTLEVHNFSAIDCNMLSDITSRISFWICGLRYLSPLFLNLELKPDYPAHAAQTTAWNCSLHPHATKSDPLPLKKLHILKDLYKDPPGISFVSHVCSGQGLTNVLCVLWQSNHNLNCILVALAVFMSSKPFRGIFPIRKASLYKCVVFRSCLQLSIFWCCWANVAKAASATSS